MTPDNYLTLIFDQFFLLLSVFLLSLLGAALCGVMLIKGKRIAAVVSASAVAVPMLLLIALSVTALSASGGTLEAEIVRVTTPVAMRLITPLIMFPSAAILLVCLAIAGWRSKGRSFKAGVWGVGCGALAALGTIVAGLMNDDLMLSLFRAGVYLLVGLLVSLALSHRGDETNGPEVGASAALTGGLFISAVELSSLAMSEFFVLLPLGGRCFDKRDIYVDVAMSAHQTDQFVVAGWVVLLVVVLGLVGVVRESRAVGRKMGAVSIVWVALIGSVLALGAPSPADMKGLGHLLPTIEASKLFMDGEWVEIQCQTERP